MDLYQNKYTEEKIMCSVCENILDKPQITLGTGAQAIEVCSSIVCVIDAFNDATGKILEHAEDCKKITYDEFTALQEIIHDCIETIGNFTEFKPRV